MELHGKYAKKLGDCQCVTPGIILSFISLKILIKFSPSFGGFLGRPLRNSPGFIFDRTGYDSIFS